MKKEITDKLAEPAASKKRVAIQAKHAKAYRKRHYVLLVSALLAAFGLLALAVSLHVQSAAGTAESQDFVASRFLKPTSTQQTVTSSYGFNFQYDPRRLYVSALDGTTGKLYMGRELMTARPYQNFKFSSTLVAHTTAPPDTVSLDYYATDSMMSRSSLTSIEQNYLATASAGAAAPSVASTQVVILHGISFQKTIWTQATTGRLSAQLESHFVSYTALINARPLIIRTNNHLGSAGSSVDIDAIAASLSTAAPTLSYQAPAPAVTVKLVQNRNLLDKLLFTPASAASDAMDSQAISALYAPTVVKIYNAYCMDISIKGALFAPAACAGTSGSGFFVSSDGYIATNGHVATANPKDLVIQNAYTTAAAGNGKQLVALAEAAGLNVNTLNAITDGKQLLDTIFNAVYAMPDSDFTKSNAVQNLLVGLDSKDPDVAKLLAVTAARQRYTPTDDVKAATLAAADYRAYDGIVKYRDSDVALIKLPGDNYPVVKLGSLSEVSQGSNLNILGYPVAASNNSIVAQNISEVTLTSGKVSAIKTANGDSRQLIETTTTIGHGNSGGPVFDDAGHVVGIATYTIDGSGQGDGTFNYVRDIADLQALAAAANITFKTNSSTQLDWQKAITAFDSAHYSKSLKLFSTVRDLYPQHPTIDVFESRAQQNIAEGKDVKDMPLGWLIGGAVAALLLASVAITWIVRHHARHQIYKLVSGQVGAEHVNFMDHPNGGYYYPVLPAAEPVVVATANQLHPR